MCQIPILVINKNKNENENKDKPIGKLRKYDMVCPYFFLVFHTLRG